jgi:HPt (histidine-containing phosphotransfer) domain-containing protein
VPSDEVLAPDVVAALRRAQDAIGNPGLIRQLAGLFLTNTPGKMDRLREAVTAGDAAAIREVAHALKSNCGMLGATRMADACACMEEAASRDDLTAAALAFEDASQQLPTVLKSLSTLE